jgi:hypothetical protein
MGNRTLAERLKSQGLTLKERLKVYDDELYKQGMDSLEERLGWFEAQQFLDLYYIRRFMDCRGRDYTRWCQENDPWAGMSIEEISHEADKLWQRTHGVKSTVEVSDFAHANKMVLETV